MEVAEKWLLGSSTYATYQTYFMEQGIASFTWAKVPYVVMMGVTKTVAFVSLIAVLASRRKIRWAEAPYLIVVSMAYVYFGVARGTNFEVFEIIAVLLFCAYWRYGGRRIPLRIVLLVAVFLGGSLVWFYNSVSARGFIFTDVLGAGVEYDAEGVISSAFPPLVFVTTVLFGYFGFGFLYLSHALQEVWFAGPEYFVAGLIPSGYELSSGVSLFEVVEREIERGVRWRPDAAVFIDSMGMVGAFFLIWCLGRYVRHVSIFPDSWLINSIRFLIFFQMLSLPTGNFVWVMTSTQILILFLFASLLKGWLDRMVLGNRVRPAPRAAERPADGPVTRVFPDEAGIGHVPASAANAASDRTRPGCDQARYTGAATTDPTPGSSVSSGA